MATQLHSKLLKLESGQKYLRHQSDVPRPGPRMRLQLVLRHARALVTFSSH